MHIEIIDAYGTPVRIDSTNPATIGAWFAEQVPRLMSADVRTMDSQLRIRVYPNDRDEMVGLSRMNGDMPITQQFVEFLTGQIRIPERSEYMSKVLWCDIGQHPFPANQNGATTIKVEQQVRNQWGGIQPTDIVQDVCRACAEDAGIKQVADMSSRQSQEEADNLARDIRDATGGASRFRKTMNAITGKQQPDAHAKAEEARAKGYDPDYVAFLEAKANEPLVVDGEVIG